MSLFEGSEKRLEISFVIPDRSRRGLRQISRWELDQLLDLTQCSIITTSHADHVDAYVLTESSLFVFRDTFILKTCGQTRILKCIGQLLSITASHGIRARSVKYSRASFLFPDDQVYPHQKFETEVLDLNHHFSYLDGSSYVMGDRSHGLQWHLFYATTEKVPHVHGSSVEMCLTGLNRQLAQSFVRTEAFVDARTTTTETGLANLLPDAVLDDYMFEPCGYSMNGLSSSGILTVHVTPEEDCSYASVEFSCLKPNSMNLQSMVAQVLQLFDPREIHIAVHSASFDDICALKELHGCLCGYVSDGLSVQYLSDGSHVLFKTNILEKTQKLEYAAPFASFMSSSSRSDDISVFDGYPVEDSQSSTSLEDKPLMLLSRSVERKYGIQNLGTVELARHVRELIHSKELDQTFYIMNLTTVQRLYLHWRCKLPRVEPMYAVKCNPDVVLITLLGSLGAGFDCASRDEMKLVLDLGVHPSKIILANACKHLVDVYAAAQYGVNLTTFDTLFELEKLKQGSPACRALLRIRADDPDARCLLGNKYGAQMFNLPALYQKAKDLNVNVVGVSFHVGSGATNPDAFSSAISFARKAFDLGLEYGFEMSILDIGGGFSSGKVDSHMEEFDAIQQAVNRALDRHFPVEDGIKIIAEPGRYFAETASTLACYVQGKRERNTPDGIPLKDYWITDGLYGSFNCILYDHALPRALPLKCQRNKGDRDDGYYSSTVFGPTCDGLDTVLVDYMLPDLHPGDWLLFPDMGAYTLAGASNFNGMNATNVKVYYVWADFEE